MLYSGAFRHTLFCDQKALVLNGLIDAAKADLRINTVSLTSLMHINNIHVKKKITSNTFLARTVPFLTLYMIFKEKPGKFITGYHFATFKPTI